MAAKQMLSVWLWRGQNFTPGTDRGVGGPILGRLVSQADGCTTGMSRHLPSEPSLQGLVLQVSGRRVEAWKAFWLASLL